MEIWKDIKGYEGLYQISNTQKIKRNNRILKQKNSPNGYKRVALCKNGLINDFYVHRLLAHTFIQNPDNKPTVNHINGIKDDNRLENLEWATYSENLYHSYEILGREKVNRLTDLTRNKNQYRNPKTGKYEKSII